MFSADVELELEFVLELELEFLLLGWLTVIRGSCSSWFFFFFFYGRKVKALGDFLESLLLFLFDG